MEECSLKQMSFPTLSNVEGNRLQGSVRVVAAMASRKRGVVVVVVVVAQEELGLGNPRIIGWLTLTSGVELARQAGRV